jgi:hypothetical protein
MARPAKESTVGAMSSEVRQAVGRLSDQLWQRYGETQISPAYLAMLDETCAAIEVFFVIS